MPDHLLKHVSRLSWEHINLTGIYTWDAEHQMPEGFRFAQTSGSVTPRRMTFMLRSTLACRWERFLFRPPTRWVTQAANCSDGSYFPRWPSRQFPS
ncbi:hypothetical protein NKJ23_19265 [Mesorhizobium sp. M0184]|uniref:hypothetical protein n=1 Tax=Mesorhizobium sp. M0184 TaxID=2956906 RepID=UPI003336FC4A